MICPLTKCTARRSIPIRLGLAALRNSYEARKGSACELAFSGKGIARSQRRWGGGSKRKARKDGQAGMSQFLLRNKKENKYSAFAKKALSEKGNDQICVKRGAGAYRPAHPKASMTVEAAVVLPLFAGFLVLLMFYFRVMEVQISVEQAAAYTARTSAAAIRDEGASVSYSKMTLLLYQNLKRMDVPLNYIDKGAAGVSLLGSDFTGTSIRLHVTYKITFPIGFFGKLRVPTEQEVTCRKWCGWVDQDAGTGSDIDYVYVTETGRAYHNSRGCPYLDLSIKKVGFRAITSLRNKSGGKYRRCSLCTKKGKKGEYRSVYITDYGDCYHADLQCSSLKRTIYLLPRAKIGSRKGCTKCTGG